MRLAVDAEFGNLRHVLLGTVRNFRMHDPINNVQRHFYPIDPPKLPVLLNEQNSFVEVLHSSGVTVSWVTPLADAGNQIFVRDIATVIGNTLVIGSMKEPLRQHEPEALTELLREITSPILRVDSGIIEGGDILLDQGVIFIGLSERTNKLGLDWLCHHFGDQFNIVPIQLKPPFLHADVVFNVLGSKLALVYPPALESKSFEELRRRYSLVEVTEQEQFQLATNVLSLSPSKVVSDARHARLNTRLRDHGFEVVDSSTLKYQRLEAHSVVALAH